MIPLTLQEHNDIFNRIDTLFMFGQLPLYGNLLMEIGHTKEELEYAYGIRFSFSAEITYPRLNRPITQKDIQNEKEKYFNYLTYHISFNKMERQLSGGDRSPDTIKREQEEYLSLFVKDTLESNDKEAVKTDDSSIQEHISSNSKDTSDDTKTTSTSQKVQTLEDKVIYKVIEKLDKIAEPSFGSLARVHRLSDAPEHKVEKEENQDHLPWHKQDYHKPIPLLQRDPTLTYFIHQKKAIREVFTKIVDDKLRAILLQAGTGTGKTFIAGGVIEQLWHKDLNFFGGCISPWPCVYITRASIVEQTARVMERRFNLDPIRQCYVMNIEQMRAKFGEYFLKEKVKVVRGEETVEWTWIPYMAPRLIVLDESHLAKNERSTQSQIIQAVSDLPNTIMLAMSATAGMRVCEFKYFCVNSHMEL